MAQSSLDLGKKFQFDVSFRYISALVGLAIPAYSSADARLAWRLRPDLELSLNGRDLLQAHHLEYPADAGPDVGIERNAYLQLTWTK